MTKEQELLKLAREMDLEMYGEEQGTEGYHFKFAVKTIELGRTEEGLETFQKAWVALQEWSNVLCDIDDWMPKEVEDDD